MIVVADASPLHCLVLISQVELLPHRMRSERLGIQWWYDHRRQQRAPDLFAGSRGFGEAQFAGLAAVADDDVPDP